jgi:sn-glycerol 3-phosphate transport system permease protein
VLATNLVYAAFDTFATIRALTDGGPAGATETLIVKVWRDGMVNLDFGSSSAQSVLLMLFVVMVVAVQIRLLGRRETA